MQQPMFDPLDPRYKSVTGAIPTGKETRFTLLLPRQTGSGWVNFCLRSPGGDVKKYTMEKGEETQEAIFWTCKIAPAAPGVYHYYFEAEGAWVPAIIKMDDMLTGSFDYRWGEFQLTVYAGEFTTPDWIKGGVMYQIFPDRFARSGIAHPCPPGRVLREDWGGLPVWQPNTQGKIENNDYFGGDLPGICQKLPYLHDLGVTCLYLNPVFYAGSNHRYDTSDYEQIDPLLGTEKDLSTLCTEAKKLGIRVVLDGVFSHTGDNSRYFNRYGSWPSPGACQKEGSPYDSWYTFAPDGTYRSWWGIDTLPEVNETDPSYMEYICGESGILEKWLRLGISGWRLDVADELPDEFLFALRRRVKAVDPQAYVVGEVWEDATTKEGFGKLRPYLWGDQLDGVMNYPFKEAVLRLLSTGNGEDFVRSIRQVMDHYPKPALDVLMNFVSTHDVERAITRLGGDPLPGNDRAAQAIARLTPSQYSWGKVLLKLAYAILFFLPGVPCIYYGDEVGMSGHRDPFNRGCMNWDTQDGDLRDYVGRLSRLRGSLPQLAQGECTPVFTNGVLRLRREDVVLVVNLTDTPLKLEGAAVLFGEEILMPYTCAAVEEREK